MKSGTKEIHGTNWKTTLKTAISTYLSIVTLNVNGLNVLIKRYGMGVLVVAQWKRTPLGTMRMQDRSLASLSGLSIWRCHELWCKSQTQFGSGISVTVA